LIIAARHDGFSCFHLNDARALAETCLSRHQVHRTRAHNEQFAQIAIAHLRNTRPSFGLPPEEFCLGVSPRKAANSRGPAKLVVSWMVGIIAEAVIGPKPGMLTRRLAVSSF
jgi:hypothetical protein